MVDRDFVLDSDPSVLARIGVNILGRHSHHRGRLVLICDREDSIAHAIKTCPNGGYYLTGAP